MNKARIFALSVCLLLIIGLFVGCAAREEPVAEDESPTQKEPAPAAETPEKVELTLLIDPDTDRAGIEAVSAVIEERFNIATIVEIRPGALEGENFVRTRLATGDMSDLSFFNSGSLFMTLNPPEHFVDLTDEPFMGRVYDSFKEVVSVDGRAYSIPGGTASGGGWLYNKKVYEELGLSVPRTWEQLMANNQVIRDAGKVAVIGSFRDNWTAQLILLADYFNVHAQDPDFADRFTRNEAKFADTPLALRGFEKLHEVYKLGFMNEDLLSVTFDDALAMLAEGRGAHYPMLSGVLSTIAERFPEAVNDIGIFAQPSDSEDVNGLTVWMPGGISLYRESPNIESMKTWADFFLSDEGVEIFMEAQKPTGPFVIKGVDLPAGVWPAISQMAEYFEAGNTAPALEFISPLKGPNLPAICVEVGSGMITPIEGAKAYDADVARQARQLNLPGW